MAEVKKIPTREEVPTALTWNLEDIFQTVASWNEEFTAISTLLEKAPSFEGTLKNGAQAMLETLQYRDEVYTRIGILYTYAHMKSDQDTTNSEFQGLEGRSRSLIAKVSTALSFLTPEILSLSEDLIKNYLEENEALRLYKHELEEINEQREHVLPAEQEAILAQMSEVTGASANTFGMLNNADLEFPVVKDEEGNDVQLTHGNYVQFLDSADRSVREAGFKAMYETFGKFKNTFATTLSGNVKAHNVSAKIRNYDSARHAAMSNNSIPEKVYDQLLSTVHNNIGLMHRYLDLRKNVLEVDELHMWDVYTPLVKETTMKVTYEEATEHMLNSFAAMGDDYVGIVKKALADRWVDVVENKGKRSGAYSSGSYGTNPYILMNWQDNLDNLYTLVHEFGHSVHSYYSRNNQPAVYGDYSIFVAEVASTCNEELLTDYLLKTVKDDNLRIYILNHWLDSFRGTIIRQTMFAEFEHIIHEMDRNGEPLTADTLSAKYHELNKFYFGDNMVSDDEIALEWARIPHFYYNYYVYQYATGKSAAIALSSQILNEGEVAVERYVNNFLKAGCSDSPINVLRAAGVDMESAKPIELAFELFEKNLAELERLLAK
ncbi:oligoendopeptidase F [Kurthia sibirica]|uniref:Oligopeptidase F n=1 Tax=Kurthia sibirica TaxID=202750 RepID=A0A2U3AMV1_9BACL|nr:oligoendopeptidase F [Kurthia sibirica]PWI25852.1 oligoendopeptidase F [Kurthia sibirica]GEK34288.1 oligoendopeptidase F [Kurthia sibirica]